MVKVTSPEAPLVSGSALERRIIYNDVLRRKIWSFLAPIDVAQSRLICRDLNDFVCSNWATREKVVRLSFRKVSTDCFQVSLEPNVGTGDEKSKRWLLETTSGPVVDATVFHRIMHHQPTKVTVLDWETVKMLYFLLRDPSRVKWIAYIYELTTTPMRFEGPAVEDGILVSSILRTHNDLIDLARPRLRDLRIEDDADPAVAESIFAADLVKPSKYLQSVYVRPTCVFNAEAVQALTKHAQTAVFPFEELHIEAASIDVSTLTPLMMIKWFRAIVRSHVWCRSHSRIGPSGIRLTKVLSRPFGRPQCDVKLTIWCTHGDVPMEWKIAFRDEILKAGEDYLDVDQLEVRPYYVYAHFVADRDDVVFAFRMATKAPLIGDDLVVGMQRFSFARHPGDYPAQCLEPEADATRLFSVSPNKCEQGQTPSCRERADDVANNEAGWVAEGEDGDDGRGHGGEDEGGGGAARGGDPEGGGEPPCSEVSEPLIERLVLDLDSDDDEPPQTWRASTPSPRNNFCCSC